MSLVGMDVHGDSGLLFQLSFIIQCHTEGPKQLRFDFDGSRGHLFHLSFDIEYQSKG